MIDDPYHPDNEKVLTVQLPLQGITTSLIALNLDQVEQLRPVAEALREQTGIKYRVVLFERRAEL